MLRRLIWCPLLLLLFILHPTSTPAEEQTLMFKEDGKKWNYGGHTDVGELTFIRPGENSENWTETVIFHHLDAKDIPLDVYYRNFMTLLNKKSGDLFESRLISSDNNMIIFEWWINHNFPGSQHGWIKITKDDEGLQFFRYTTRNVKDIDTIRPIWENILKKYSVKMTPIIDKESNKPSQFKIDVTSTP